MSPRHARPNTACPSVWQSYVTSRGVVAHRLASPHPQLCRLTIYLNTLVINMTVSKSTIFQLKSWGDETYPVPLSQHMGDRIVVSSAPLLQARSHIFKSVGGQISGVPCGMGGYLSSVGFLKRLFRGGSRIYLRGGSKQSTLISFIK